MRDLISKSEIAVRKLNPKRIYVENIRAILNTNQRIAQFVCDIAVRLGYFEKHYSVECKNDSCGKLIKTADSLEGLGRKLHCDICEDNHEELYEWSIEQLNVFIYYSYVKGSYEIA